MSKTTLWCIVEGDATPFTIYTSPTTFIADLKELIQEKTRVNHPARKLNLWQVDVYNNTTAGEIDWGKYQFNLEGKRPLGDMKRISNVWPELPSDDHLHIYVTLGMDSPFLPQGFGERIGHIDGLREYQDILIKVKDLETFEQSDIRRNQIRSAEELMKLPNFVKSFEQKLVRKPRLHPEVCILYCSITTFLDRIFTKTNLSRKRAMSSDWSCYISHPLCLTIGKKVGDRRGQIDVP